MALRRIPALHNLVGALLGSSLVLASSVATWVAFESPVFAQPKEPKPATEVTLAIGELKSIPVAGSDGFAMTDKDVASVVLSPNQNSYLITGRKEGTTTLVVQKAGSPDQRYEITVASQQLGRVVDELTKLLDGTPGVRVRRIGSRLFIEGGVSTEADSKRIQQIASVYGNQVVNLAVLGQPAAERKLLVRIDFFFVQYEKSSSYAVGIGWPSAIGGVTAGGPSAAADVVTSKFDYDLLGKTVTTAQASIVGQPLPRIDIASRNGWARVLKQSTVITGNGSEAKFSSGGEQNFIQNAGFSVGLVSVKYGTDVVVLPRYDSTTRDVEVRVGADIADLTPSTGGTVPGRSTTKLDTLVTLKLGQALVLSGIKTMTRRNTIDGVPGLSEIPVIGVLFGSHQRADVDTEGAVFIIPSVVDQVPKSSLEVIRNAMSTYKDFSGDMRNLETFSSEPPAAK